MTQSREELAKELQDKFEHQTDIGCFDCDAESGVDVVCWEDLAAYVQRRVLEARIEELNFCHKVSHMSEIMKELAYWKSQLKGLDNET